MRTTLEENTSHWPELWQAAYHLLEQKIVEPQLKAWIQPIEFISSEESESGLKVGLAVPNDFSAQWIRDHYEQDIQGALEQVSGKHCHLEMIIRHRPTDTSFDELGETHRKESPAPTVNTRETPSINPKIEQINQDNALNIDRSYTFENFVVGASNQFAHASAVAVAENPAHQYNPLFLYSSPGLGKTHLLHAIANHVLSKRSQARVAYVSAENFVNELIESLQRQKMTQFRSKYRSGFDVLLIDDIQFIAGKKQTEEEFFHTFNALYSSRRQIVLSSDRPPKEIDRLEERIRTRFEWGLVADIQAPEIETRIAILKSKAERDDIYLPDEVGTFLATHIKTNVRELEGLLIRLQAQSSLTGAEISLEMARQELKNVVNDDGNEITVEFVQETVAKHFRVKTQDLKSSARSKSVALPRQIAMYLIRKYTGLGYKEIGQYFGGKDHTTILHACNKIETQFAQNPETRQLVETIQNQL